MQNGLIKAVAPKGFQNTSAKRLAEHSLGIWISPSVESLLAEPLSAFLVYGRWLRLLKGHIHCPVTLQFPPSDHIFLVVIGKLRWKEL